MRGLDDTLCALRDALEPNVAGALNGAAQIAEFGSLSTAIVANIATVSQAISLKRIADTLDVLAFGDNDRDGVLRAR